MPGNIAWVFSGGGNLGALEAGAIRALVEARLRPDMLAGTSAGAANAVVTATWPNERGVEYLWEAWQLLDKDDVFPGSFVQWGWRLVSGAESLCANTSMKATLSKWIPQGVEFFRDLDVPCWVVAADSHSGRPVVIGGPKSDTPLIDGIMASAALPGMVPSYNLNGQRLVDGGAVSNVPITAMVDRGATTIYAVSAIEREPDFGPIDSRFPILVALYRVVKMMQAHHLRTALRFAADNNVSVRYLALSPPLSLSAWDFSHGEQLLDEGYRRAQKWLRYV